MSSYLNKVVRRTKPLTRCQCAVLAVLCETWSSVDAVWRRKPVYASNKRGRTQPVGYGTVSAVLVSLVQQGFAESRAKGKSGKYKEYRSVR